MDEDLVDDDAMPPAEINSNDIKAALAAQQKFYVQVDDQTAGDILFIGISVVQQADRFPEVAQSPAVPTR